MCSFKIGQSIQKCPAPGDSTENERKEEREMVLYHELPLFRWWSKSIWMEHSFDAFKWAFDNLTNGNALEYISEMLGKQHSRAIIYF